MLGTQPHYLLFSEASPGPSRPPRQANEAGGRWKFVLEATQGTEQLEASDAEDNLTAERLELLAVVRGLEALSQPSRVTLITASRYVCRGLRFGLAEWRENGWQWELFGQMSEIANADLWRRLDAALRIHDVRCRTLRFDGPHVIADRESPRQEAPRATQPVTESAVTEPVAVPRRASPRRASPRRASPRRASRAGQWLRGWLRRSPLRAAQLL